MMAAFLMQAAGSPSPLSYVFLFGPLFVIMYFFMFRPQQQERKRIQALQAALKAGDKVVTSSGIYGTVNGIDGDTIILKIADQVKIRIARAAISHVEASEDAK